MHAPLLGTLSNVTMVSSLEGSTVYHITGNYCKNNIYANM